MQKNEAKLTDHIEGLEVEYIDLSQYEVSFRRWLVNEIDSGRMTHQEARERFQLSPTEYKKIIRRWQEKYSDEMHVSLSIMNSKDRADNKKLEQRIKELEKQLEFAQMKNVALETLIDVAEKDLKIEIRKKSGPKQ